MFHLRVRHLEIGCGSGSEVSNLSRAHSTAVQAGEMLEDPAQKHEDLNAASFARRGECSIQDILLRDL